MWKTVAYGVITVFLGLSALWSVYLDSQSLLTLSELPPEQWKYLDFHFYRVMTYNLTLTSAVTYTAYRAARLLLATIKGD